MATQELVRPVEAVTVRIPEPRHGQLPRSEARDRSRPSVRVGADLAPVTTTYVRRPAPAVLRLTRRGRLLLTGAVLVLLVLAVVLLRPGGPALAGDSDRGPATRTVVVQQGQTLWQIARDVRPGADPRETVQRIQELNGLTTAQVWAGQPLVVPS